MTTKGHLFKRVTEEGVNVKLVAAMPKLGIKEPIAMLCDEQGNDIDGIQFREFLSAGWVPVTPGGKARLRAFSEANGIAMPERFLLRPGGIAGKQDNADPGDEQAPAASDDVATDASAL